MRFRVVGVSARTGAILIQDRNLLRPDGQRAARRRIGCQPVSAGRQLACRKRKHTRQAGNLAGGSGKLPDFLHDDCANAVNGSARVLRDGAFQTDPASYKFLPDGTGIIFVGPSAFPNGKPVALAFDRFGNLFVSTEDGAF